jgi:dihydrofolate reductase
MRRLIVTNIMSLDGYYEGPGGNVMALPMDHRFDAYNAERLGTAGTLLLGRRTYELFKGFWPQMAEHPDATPAQRQISVLEDAVEKVVVSDTLAEADTTPWRDTTRVVGQSEAHEEIAALKQQDGGDILVFGSRTLWHQLLAAGLVDELHLIVGGVILGGGTPMFGPAPARPLALLDIHRWDDSSNALLRYTTAGGDGA